MLSGHVIVEDFAIIGGMTPVHQFSRIGCYAMVGGFSRVPRDIPPYTIGGGFPYKFGGVNIIGLKRHKFSMEVRSALSKAFKITYRSGLHLEEAITQIEQEVEPLDEVKHWINFCKKSKRGLIGLEGVTRVASESDGEDQEFEI
jgi:UDP-N-acetylglucosamine acyltransferase